MREQDVSFFLYGLEFWLSRGALSEKEGCLVPATPLQLIDPGCASRTGVPYRDCVAVLTRGVDAAETLALMRGDWHCGYDPYLHRVAPQCTPLAGNRTWA
jgi:hypothetical protein